MELSFGNEHIVVTGGTGSLGSAVVHKLLEDGALCSVPCYDASELDDFEHRDHERLFYKTGVDLVEEESALEFYSDAVENHGNLWASVHIAGGFGMSSIEDAGKEAFMKQINMNLVTCYNASRAAIGEFRRGDVGGRIVNIAARPALEPRQGAGMTGYTTAKAGVAAFTQALAAEVAREDILVNAVAPSIIDTEANRETMPDADFDSWPKPKEIASHILYLISPQNSVSRGGVIPVYGKS